MPTINLPAKKDRSEYPRWAPVVKNDDYKYVYNTKTWRDLRLNYLATNPLCERCLLDDKTVAACDVHHKIPISKGKNRLEKEILGFDWKNLMSVCKECHYAVHNRIYKKKEK